MKTPQQGRRTTMPSALNIIDDAFMGEWTMERVKVDAKQLLAAMEKLLADKPKAGAFNIDLRRALLDVIHDIEVSENRLIEGFSQTNFQTA
jgi:hypothetical protein